MLFLYITDPQPVRLVCFRVLPFDSATQTCSCVTIWAWGFWRPEMFISKWFHVNITFYYCLLLKDHHISCMYQFWFSPHGGTLPARLTQTFYVFCCYGWSPVVMMVWAWKPEWIWMSHVHQRLSLNKFQVEWTWCRAVFQSSNSLLSKRLSLLYIQSVLNATLHVLLSSIL